MTLQKYFFYLTGNTSPININIGSIRSPMGTSLYPLKRSHFLAIHVAIFTYMYVFTLYTHAHIHISFAVNCCVGIRIV